MTRFRSILTVLLFVTVVFLGENALAGGKTPSAVVGSFQDMLIGVMKTAENTTVKQRYQDLEQGAGQSFHVPLMVQIATGKYWKEATRDERTKLVSAFLRMSISTLATLFDGYDGEIFRQLGDKEGPSKTRLVMTELVKSDKSTVDIAYVTRKFGQEWRIIDVIVDSGISELKVMRSEYHLVLKEKGIPGLIDLLNSKADQLISG